MAIWRYLGRPVYDSRMGRYILSLSFIYFYGTSLPDRGTALRQCISVYQSFGPRLSTKKLTRAFRPPLP